MPGVRKAALLGSLGLGLTAGLLWLLLPLPWKEGAFRRPSSGEEGADPLLRGEAVLPPPVRRGTEVASPSGAGRALEALREVLGNHEKAREAAAALRRLCRRSPGARAEVCEALLDPGTDVELRGALALVLGSLPGNDGVLLEALRSLPPGEESLSASLCLALGALREPLEEDRVFGMGDRPWGVESAGGLGISVRRKIEDPAVLQALGARLLGGPGLWIRRAAALSLRHSLDAKGARDAFRSALLTENSDSVAGLVGEALARWAGGNPSHTESPSLVSSLLSRASEPRLEGLRFRLEDDFRSLPLGKEGRRKLMELAESGADPGMRSWAALLLAENRRFDREERKEIRSLLEKQALEDREASLRDLSARLLGKLPLAPSTLRTLSRILAGDPGWNVRFSALESLAGFGPLPLVLASLKRASRDPDGRVARRARAELRRLRK